MAKERRGGFLLFLGALALLGITGAIVYWVTHREQRCSVMVFHWIPGPAPLKIVGTPPWATAKGENIGPTLDPRLFELLGEMAIGGELRMVSELPVSREHAGALLLKKLPESPIALQLVDRRAAVYIQQDSRIVVIPEKSSSLGMTVALTPDKPLTMFTFMISSPQGGGSSGVTLATWW